MTTSSPLSIDDLNDILDTLIEAEFPKSEWFDFGRRLKLSHDDLKEIEANYKQNERCLYECTACWLKKTPSQDRTWNTIGSAIRSMGIISVAEAIEKAPSLETDCIKSNLEPTTGNIAAIGFGTNSVSLVYTLRWDKNVHPLILDEDRSIRFHNAVLLEKSGYQMKISAIGKMARKMFNSLRSSQHSNYTFFENFDMFKIEEKTQDIQSLVESFSGEQFYLVEVIAFILKYLKDQLIDHLSRTVTPLKTTDFDWVITVPSSIWDEIGTGIIRDAAYMAGLTTSDRNGITQLTPVFRRPLPVPVKTNPDHLALVLEPEAVAFHIKNKIELENKGVGYVTTTEHSTRYMVIDIGDAFDIVQVDGDNMLVVPTGNEVGGRHINEAFSKMLQELVGDRGFEKYLASGDYSKQSAALNEILYKEFESEKVLFGRCKVEKEISVTLAAKFVKYYDRKFIQGVKKMKGVEYENDILYISKRVVESKLFGPTLDGIISCIHSAIKDNGFKVNALYLVGEFGTCNYVQEKVIAAIQQLYRTKGLICHVIVPQSFDLPAAKGAVSWRKNIK